MASSGDPGKNLRKHRISNATAQRMEDLMEAVQKANRAAGGWQSSKSKAAHISGPKTPEIHQPAEPSSRRIISKGKEKMLEEESPGTTAEVEERSTWLGRYGVWHPEASVVREEPGGPYELPEVDELEAVYRLPIKRPRAREDSAGGAIMFQDHGFAPKGVKVVVPQKCILPQGATVQEEFPDRGPWNEVLVKGKVGKVGIKRALDGQSSGSRKMPHKLPPEFDTERILVEAGMKEDSAQPVDPELAHITNGDEAIKFFAEREESKPAKFVYCNRVASDKVFRPYDLEVVPRNKVGKLEYFTISTYGMIHIEIVPGLLH